MNRAVSLLSHDILSDALQERCNPILPLRDLKIVKAKVIRSPKLDTQKLFDLHGKVPESMEDKPRVVEVAPVVAAAAATAARICCCCCDRLMQSRSAWPAPEG
jgi:small subunit ribosomal protein S3Ae